MFICRFQFDGCSIYRRMDHWLLWPHLHLYLGGGLSLCAEEVFPQVAEWIGENPASVEQQAPRSFFSGARGVPLPRRSAEEALTRARSYHTGARVLNQ